MADTWKMLFGAISYFTTTSTGTGSAQTIAHGLGAAPNMVSVVPGATSCAVTNLYADATNVYLTVSTDIAYSLIAAIL